MEEDITAEEEIGAEVEELMVMVEMAVLLVLVKGKMESLAEAEELVLMEALA